MKTLKLIAVLILLPVALGLFGTWELQRSADRAAELAETQSALQEIRPQLEALAAKRGAVAVVDLDGESVGVMVALSRVAQAEGDLRTLGPLSEVMRGLAKGVIVLGALATLVGVLGLLGLGIAGSRARQSRDQLLRTFTRVSRVLPYVLVGHIIAMGAAVAAILAYEALGIWHAGRISAGEIKLMLAALVVVLVCLYSIWEMGKQLRVMLRMFEPTAMDVLGRAITVEQAPVLWAYVDDLAKQLGALAPEHIVLGMTEGFYVTSSDLQLIPSNTVLKGRTLHIPLMYLSVLDSAETSAVIGHELAHFAGADTEYSLRFLPIYDGIGRSLGVIAETMNASDLLQRTILRPAFMLGIYFMESFHHAANHWSRSRELAADAAGARLAGNAAAASALVRISAVDPLLHERIGEHLGRATRPTADRLVPHDLSTSVLHELAAQTFSLPAEELAAQLPHPSDTHPSNGERVAALQISADEAVRRGTRAMDALHACAAMDYYFGDPQALRLGLTQDFLEHYVARDAEVVDELRTYASTAVDDVKLHEGARTRGIFSMVFLSMFLLLGIGLLAFTVARPDLVQDKKPLLMLCGLGLIGLMSILMVISLRMIKRADMPALLLTPEHLVFNNFKAPIAIRHIADFGITDGQGVVLTLYLEGDAPLPERVSSSYFAPNAKLLKRKRAVQLQLMQVRRDGKKLKAQALAELIGTYLNAGNARHLLQQRFEGGV